MKTAEGEAGDKALNPSEAPLSSSSCHIQQSEMYEQPKRKVVSVSQLLSSCQLRTFTCWETVRLKGKEALSLTEGRLSLFTSLSPPCLVAPILP